MNETLLQLRVEAEFGWDELVDVDAVEAPAVAFGHRQEFAPALREGDVERTLTELHAVHEELQDEGGLAAARAPFDEVGPLGRIAAVENVIEPRYPRGDRHGVGGGGGGHSATLFIGALSSRPWAP